MVLALTAKGLTTGEISAYFHEIYGANISKDTISVITNRVIEEMTERGEPALEIKSIRLCLLMRIYVKVRDGQVANRPFYIVLGVTTSGERDILGIWAGDASGGEGAKYWLNILTEVKNRGVDKCVCIAMIWVCDGLKGLPETITTVWPLAIVQTLRDPPSA